MATSIALTDGMTLYHGSYTEVSAPDLAKCAKYKDFGQGFYLTTSRQQAQSFAKIATAKARFNGIAPHHQNYGVVSSFHFSSADGLRVHSFATADAEWLHCVVAHRKRNCFPDVIASLQNYDVIGGKIANDNTNATIITYMAGTFGEIGSQQADAMCITLLLPERLHDQFCFRTQAALAKITFVGSEKVWL